MSISEIPHYNNGAEKMLKIISVGRNKMFGEEERDYLKRIGTFSKIEIIGLKENSSENAEVAMKKEGGEILSRLKEKEFFALDRRGAEFTSEEFSGIIKNNPDAIFVIGGAYGLSQEVISRAKKSISFSRMTFTHEIARVLLLEQIYRGFAILNRRKYHK